MTRLNRREMISRNLSILLLMSGLGGCVKSPAEVTVQSSPIRTPTPHPHKQLPYHSVNGSNNPRIPDPKDIEKQIHEFTNMARERHSKSRIEWDNDLAFIARRHSKDMEKRGYFSHNNPDGESAQERVEKHELRYWNVFENIAGSGATEGKSPEELAEDIFEMWITSEKGHRENILAENVDHEGVGVFLPEDGGIYATQLFGELPGHE